MKDNWLRSINQIHQGKNCFEFNSLSNIKEPSWGSAFPGGSENPPSVKFRVLHWARTGRNQLRGCAPGGHHLLCAPCVLLWKKSSRIFLEKLFTAKEHIEHKELGFKAVGHTVPDASKIFIHELHELARITNACREFYLLKRKSNSQQMPVL